jgi:6-phosphogluconolactonase
MAKEIKLVYTVCENAAELAERAAEYFALRINEAVKARGIARVAISGGNTPKETFQTLATHWRASRGTPLEQVQLFWVDERCVPPDNAESNYRMTREALLDAIAIPPGNVFRIEGELPPEEAAARYESVIREQFRLEGAETPRFDVIQLGMGDDGHTASLFPHTEALHELGRIAVANHVPQKDTWRVTLTWPVINNGRHVFFLVEGAEKAPVLADVFLGKYDPESKPAQLIRPRDGVLELLLDKTAAAKLPPPQQGQIGTLMVTQ